MGDLKPLGSEKLQGMDKIKRMLEIARFNETIPTPTNETSKSEYELTLADGNNYQIVREKTGYIIKQTISESETDYIAPIQDRKYYTSYSQALRKLNLMAKEMNEMYGNSEGVSLFSEQKKFVLKTPQKKNPVPDEEVENIPAPASPSPAPSTPPPAPSMDASTPSPEGDEVPSADELLSGGEPPSFDSKTSSEDEMPLGDEGMADMGQPEEEEHVTFKTIQKLTGKLGQKLRKYSSSEENEMSSKDVKYVINSVLSALDLNLLDEDDRDEIMAKFDMESTDEETPSLEEPQSEPESETEEEPEMSSELGEESEGGSWPELAGELTGLRQTYGSKDLGGEFSEEDGRSEVKRITDSVFSESRIEELFLKYFDITENEKKFNDKILNEREEKRKKLINKMNSEIEKLSESSQQNMMAKIFLSENSSARLIGKTNKKNLVFQLGQDEVKITPKGTII